MDGLLKSAHFPYENFRKMAGLFAAGLIPKRKKLYPSLILPFLRES